MKYLVNSFKGIFLTILVASTTSCQQAPLKQDSDSKQNGYSRVTLETLPDLFGKKLSIDGNHMTVAADGSFSGMWNDAPMVGTWVMEDDFFCRTLTKFHKPENTGSEDCQLWEMTIENVRGTRNKGVGSSFVYSIQ